MRRVQLSRQHHEAGDEKASPAVWFSELTGDIEIRTKASNDAKLTRFFRLWTWSVHRRYGEGLRIFSGAFECVSSYALSHLCSPLLPQQPHKTLYRCSRSRSIQQTWTAQCRLARIFTSSPTVAG